MNHLITFEKNPVIAIHSDRQYLRFILKNRDYYTILYESADTLIKLFKVKSKMMFMNLGKLVFNEYNPQNQFCFFLPKSTLNTLLLVGGYLDNSFKIIKNNQVLNTVYFHKVQLLINS